MKTKKNNLQAKNIFLLFILIIFFPSQVFADDIQQQVANEMAHALVANHCGKTRRPTMTAGYQSGLLMSINKTGLPKDEVADILSQPHTLLMSDAFTNEIKSNIAEGITTCDDIYSYVVTGMMPTR